MEHSQTIGAIAKALAGAQATIKDAKLNAENPFFKSKYADLASVKEACRLSLCNNGIAVVQSAEATGSTVTVTTMLTHESGEWFKSTLTGTAKDESPQAIGSCITYLRRYALAAMAGVAPEGGDDDAEAAQHRPTQAQAPRTQASPPKPAQVDSHPAPHQRGQMTKAQQLIAEMKAKREAEGKPPLPIDTKPSEEEMDSIPF